MRSEDAPDPLWSRFYLDPGKAASYEQRRTRSWWRRLSWRRELGLARGLVRETGATRWLDLACGPGRTLEALPPRAVGVDLSFAMLELGRERAARAEASFVAADAARLPFPAARFEGVLCLRFLHHLTDPLRRAVLGEARRVATRWLVASFPTNRTVRALSRRLRGKPLGPRRALADFTRELADSGWVARRARTVVPLLSETTIVLAERA